MRGVRGPSTNGFGESGKTGGAASRPQGISSAPFLALHVDFWTKKPETRTEPKQKRSCTTRVFMAKRSPKLADQCTYNTPRDRWQLPGTNSPKVIRRNRRPSPQVLSSLAWSGSCLAVFFFGRSSSARVISTALKPRRT